MRRADVCQRIAARDQRASEPAREAGGKRQEATSASGQGPSRAGASTGRGSGQ